MVPAKPVWTISVPIRSYLHWAPECCGQLGRLQHLWHVHRLHLRGQHEVQRDRGLHQRRRPLRAFPLVKVTSTIDLLKWPLFLFSFVILNKFVIEFYTDLFFIGYYHYILHDNLFKDPWVKIKRVWQTLSQHFWISQHKDLFIIYHRFLII